MLLISTIVPFLRIRPYFIVMSVTIVTLPLDMGFIDDARFQKSSDSRFIVTVTITARSLYLSGLPPAVTAVTLMTVKCRGSLHGLVPAVTRAFGHRNGKYWRLPTSRSALSIGSASAAGSVGS